MKSLLWACKSFDYVFIFRNNGDPSGFKNILFASNELSSTNSLEDLNEHNLSNTCGFIQYDVKNQIEHLESTNPSNFEFSPLAFLKNPLKIEFENTTVKINSSKALKIWESILATKIPHLSSSLFTFSCKEKKEDYIKTVQKLKDHIIEGDVYEICYCLEYLSKNIQLDHPEVLFNELCKKRPKPFASFVKQKEQYLIGDSPERFIKKTNNKLISQPIKGTIKRGKTFEEDQQLKEQLLNDPKERAENLMIVDLVRNDLARVSKKGSIHVDELFGIYTFPNVHQMISTISSELEDKSTFPDIIRGTFPMGSMTGAPKIMAMRLIDQYESFKRGLYSGTIGYFEKTEFDFNVVIRSLQYNTKTKTLGYHVGLSLIHI